MLEINYNNLTVLEAAYLLSNYSGHMDGDKKCVVLQ